MKNSVKAVILAAGIGRRLKPYTTEKPKCMARLAGVPIITHQIRVLESLGIKDITIVTGYKADKVEPVGHKTIYNADYRSTNMVASFMRAEKLFGGRADILAVYGDIIFEKKIIKKLLACKASICTTVDESWLNLWKIRSENPLNDAETLKTDACDNITELGKKPAALKEIQGQYMGLIKISAEFVPKVVDIYKNMDRKAVFEGKSFSNMFMTSFLQYLIDSGQELRAVTVSGGWLEVDTAGDLELYNKMHMEGTLSEYCRIFEIRDKATQDTTS